MKATFLALAAAIGLAVAMPSIALAHGGREHAEPTQVKKPKVMKVKKAKCRANCATKGGDLPK